MRVSSSLVARYIEHCRRAGLDTATLLDGLPISETTLRDRQGTIPWDPWTILLDRAQDALGGPAGIEELMAGFFPSQRALQLMAGLVVDVRSLYLVVAHRMGEVGYPGVSCRFESLADGTIRFDGAIERCARGSLPFWNATIGGFRGYPRLLGLPDARIEAEIQPHSTVMLISPPQSRTLSATALSLAAPFTAVLRRHVFGDAPISDLEAELEAAEKGSALLDEVYTAGQKLAMIHDRGRLADAVTEWMARVGCTHVDLTFQGNPPLRRCEGEATGTVYSRRLTLADQVMGRLDWALDGSDPNTAAALVDAMLPWLAIALEGCSNAEPDELQERLALVRDRWKLTRRQQLVVEMVARGRANKEIAAALGCSAKGVEAHLTILYRRAGTDCRTGLVSRVWEGVERR